MLELTVLTLIFVLLSGLVAMVDAAVLSVSKAETEELVAKGAWGALQLREVTRRLTRALVVIVIVTNIINVLGPILIGQAAVERFGHGAIGWITIVLTLATIVFSEIIPKSVGSHYAPQIARLAALSILVLMYSLYPLVWTLDALSRLFKRGPRKIGTEAQIRALSNLGRRAGYIEPDEGLLVDKAFVLNDRTAAEIMTPRDEIVALRSTTSLEEASRDLLDAGYSRYPVFGSSLDDVEGLAIARDILQGVLDGRGTAPVRSIAHEGLIVSADRHCDDLLLLFRLRRRHLAVVQDHGRTIGIVTLEDVLEELVGEISDEKDAAF